MIDTVPRRDGTIWDRVAVKTNKRNSHTKPMSNNSGLERDVTIGNRQAAAEVAVNLQGRKGATEALGLMAAALAMLDASEAPADVGAHLDHAMHRLRDWIEKQPLDDRRTDGNRPEVSLHCFKPEC